MIPLTAERITEITEGQLYAGDPDRTASGVTIDSRALAAGDCFVAIIGPRDDGHRYAQQALAAGAAVVVLQRPEICERLVNSGNAGIILVADGTRALQALARHVRDEIDPLVIAITGSVGKTTTKTLIHALLADTLPTHATPGNFNNHWGLPLSLLGLRPGHRWMVAELGMSAAGEIRALAELARPHVAVITNIAPVHMANFDSLEGVAAAKRELAESLPPDGTLIVNADDLRTAAIGEDMREHLAHVWTFGTTAEADVRAAAPEAANSGWDLDLELPDATRTRIHLPLPGAHSLANFLAAAAVAWALEIPAGTIAERATVLELPDMRGQVHRTGAFWILDDSYNASPTAMVRALDTLAGLPGSGRRILAAGDMLELGSWSEDAHREVGLHAAQLGVELVVTVGPRARDIGHGAREGGLSENAVLSFSTPEEAAQALLGRLRRGDRILVKGSRAMRMERVTRALLESAGAEGNG